MTGVLRLVCLSLCLLILGACASNPPAPVIERSTQAPRAEIPVDGLHRVNRGDTLIGIAFKYGLDYRDLAVWNRISAPYVIFPDQVLRLRRPPATAATSGVPRPASQTRSAETRPADSSAAATPARPAPERSTRPAPAPESRPAPAPQPAPPKASAPAARASEGWAWPVDGRVLRSFKAGDATRNGIDIVSKAGGPVLASAAGEVVYSGNGLIGYGELVIVKHDDRMLSAYAHNSRRLVAEGDTVRQGQKIAEVGRNDRNETVLHFEIRRDGKPVDPQQYLPRR